MESRHWHVWLVLLLGIWLIVCPWILPLIVPSGSVNGTIILDFAMTSIVVTLVFGAALSAYSGWQEWAGVFVGFWLTASPWILGFTRFSLGTTNAIVCGAVILAASVWTIFDEHRTTRA